jgi:hypothetical protein
MKANKKKYKTRNLDGVASSEGEVKSLYAAIANQNEPGL